MKTMRFLASAMAAVITAVMASSLALPASAGQAVGITGEYSVYELDGINVDEADVKPTLSLSQIEIPINKAKENPVVTVELTVSGAEAKYASTGLHVSFDERLTLVKGKLDSCASMGEAGEYLFSNNRQSGANGIFLATGGVGDYGLDGVLWKFKVQLPEDIEVGDVFPLEILYRNNGSAEDVFRNVGGPTTSAHMQGWVFTQGIEQGFIKITEAEEKETDIVPEVDPTGDVDGNARVDAGDASRILGAYAALQTGGETGFTEAQLEAADINKDGRVDATDATLALIYYAYVSTGGTLSMTEFLIATGVFDAAN